MENKPPLKICVDNHDLRVIVESEWKHDCSIWQEKPNEGFTAYILESEHEKILNELKDEMPWNSLFKDGWRICGMNHYNLKGKPHLFVSMTKGNLCITSESEDENNVWDDLKAKAELLTTK